MAAHRILTVSKPSDACVLTVDRCVVQYIMGVSQVTKTLYWYDDGLDPLVQWIAAVAGTASPPSVVSISYGIVEQAMDATVMYARKPPAHTAQAPL